jgi:F0F1-type ATP synthase assembly protein I
MRTPMEKNLQPVARTLSEANRDARYACAIQTFKSDAKLTWDFIKGALMGAVLVATPVFLIYAFWRVLA